MYNLLHPLKFRGLEMRSVRNFAFYFNQLQLTSRQKHETTLQN